MEGQTLIGPGVGLSDGELDVLERAVERLAYAHSLDSGEGTLAPGRMLYVPVPSSRDGSVYADLAGLGLRESPLVRTDGPLHAQGGRFDLELAITDGLEAEFTVGLSGSRGLCDVTGYAVRSGRRLPYLHSALPFSGPPKGRRAAVLFPAALRLGSATIVLVERALDELSCALHKESDFTTLGAGKVLLLREPYENPAGVSVLRRTVARLLVHERPADDVFELVIERVSDDTRIELTAATNRFRGLWHVRALEEH